MLHSWIFGLMLLLVCSWIIAKASNWFEVATDYLGRNMRDGVKGVTLNAIGSSFPEFMTTVFFLVLATKETLPRDLSASIGGNTGSAIFNSIVIPMLVILVVLLLGGKRFNVSNKVILRDGIFLILAELLLLIVLSGSEITHWHGWILTAFYLVYIAYTLLSMQKSERNEVHGSELEQQEHENWYEKYVFKSFQGKTFRSWQILGLAVLVLSVACAGLVEGCLIVAKAIHINPLFVALILVAAASSVPDTIISMKDARKGNHNDALSNVLGSNIFDITISMGLPLALYLSLTGQRIPFETEGSTLIDIRVMLLVVTVLTLFIYLLSKNIRLEQVFLFGLLYAIFILYTIGAAQYHAGGQGVLAQIAGTFIEFLNAPGGLEEHLRNFSNHVSGQK